MQSSIHNNSKSYRSSKFEVLSLNNRCGAKKGLQEELESPNDHLDESFNQSKLLIDSENLALDEINNVPNQRN